MEKDYKKLFSQLIHKQMAILGPQITLSKVKSVGGITVDEKGEVTSIEGDPEKLMQSLVGQFMDLSGMIMKQTMESIMPGNTGSSASNSDTSKHAQNASQASEQPSSQAQDSQTTINTVDKLAIETPEQLKAEESQPSSTNPQENPKSEAEVLSSDSSDSKVKNHEESSSQKDADLSKPQGRVLTSESSQEEENKPEESSNPEEQAKTTENTGSTSEKPEEVKSEDGLPASNEAESSDHPKADINMIGGNAIPTGPNDGPSPVSGLDLTDFNKALDELAKSPLSSEKGNGESNKGGNSV